MGLCMSLLLSIGVEEVVSTIDGKLYSSSHIEFKEGESIKVNYENTEEIEV